MHQNGIAARSPYKPQQAAATVAMRASVSTPSVGIKPVEPNAASPYRTSSQRTVPSTTKPEETHSKVRSWQRGIAEEMLPVPQHPADFVDEVHSAPSMSPDTMIVYTDGSCKGNGKKGSLAGIGVWWGEDDPRHVRPHPPHSRVYSAEVACVEISLNDALVNKQITVES